MYAGLPADAGGDDVPGEGINIFESYKLKTPRRIVGGGLPVS